MPNNPTHYVRTTDPAEAWRERLHGLMEDRGMKTSDLGREIYERELNDANPGQTVARNDATYMTGTASCARRMGRYLKTGLNGQSFPRFESMLELADFFGVSIGFLIGETECKTPDAQQASDYTGLSEEAVNAIKLATAYESAFATTGLWHEDARETLNKLLTSRRFYSMLHALQELDEVYAQPDTWRGGWKALEEEFDAGVLAKALECHDSFVNDSTPEGKKHNLEVLEEAGVSDDELEEFIKAVNDINSLMDDDYLAQRDKEAASKERRYALIGEFYQLVEELYPE